MAGQEGTDVYCHYHCLRYPSNCPKDECHCVENINSSDPSIVLDQASLSNNTIVEEAKFRRYTNHDGHEVEEFQDHGVEYKIVSVYWKYFRHHIDIKLHSAGCSKIK